MSAPEFDPKLVEQAEAALADRLSWASMHWGTEEVHPDAWPHVVRAVLTAVAPTLRAEGAAADDDALYEWLNQATDAAYQRGMVAGAREVTRTVEKYAARDHLPSVAIGARGARSVARKAVARIEAQS